MATASNVIGGPAKLNLGGSDLGHTQGGISATLTPESREVNVDEFGSSPVLIRHTGDSLTVTTPLAEWTAATLAEIYEAGNDDTTGTPPYMGLGRSAGYIYTGQALKVIPLLTADAGKLLHIFSAVATGAIELGWNNEDDTIAEVEFTALIDESQSTDGEYMGKLYVSGGS